jgi:hypothetical protein
MRTLTKVIIILLMLYVAIYEVYYQFTNGFSYFMSIGVVAAIAVIVAVLYGK